jgi:two-component system chemotaxis response regulator CheB
MNNRIRTLVVDDSWFVITSVKKRLEADPGIEVIGSARDGKEAIDKIRTLKPDVVTLDVIMPEMDGLAVLKQVMSEQPTPVIMLSALTSEGAETTIKALELGAVDFFLKPSLLHPIVLKKPAILWSKK